jgi:hypothetical protein
METVDNLEERRASLVHEWQARGLLLLLTLVEHREHCACASDNKKKRKINTNIPVLLIRIRDPVPF